MRKILSIGLIATATLFAACSGSPKKTETPETEKATTTAEKSGRTFSIDTESSKVLWTAYKLTKKIGVNGTFDAHTISGSLTGSSLDSIIPGLEISIPINSLNTKDAGRDKKIKETFFATLNTDVIEGRVSSFGNKKAGIDFTLNGITKTVEGRYEIKKEKFVWEGELILTDFDGSAALKALNEVCSAKHTDADGSSPMWPDVALRWVVKLKKN
ncbi:MAG: polyisoprenoid-binding protein YceI [Sphingobacteriales bacterium]|jgi:polyisoprenoid-binding protein YceI